MGRLGIAVTCSLLALAAGCNGSTIARGGMPSGSVDVIRPGGDDLGDMGTTLDASVPSDAGPADDAVVVSDAGTDTGVLPTDCHGMLDALGLTWRVASAQPGIADPVIVEPLIAGVTYRYVSDTTPRALLMDCELAPRLVRLSQLVSSRYGVSEIVHIGIYNYRCIGGGNPDTDGCTPSQHAYARAIDLHAFRLPDGTEYNVTSDFVITMHGDSCPLASSNEPDRILKEIACSLWSDRIFQIVLTPNYNADHRDHFHVDMTTGSHFLGAGVEGVDPTLPGLGE